MKVLWKKNKERKNNQNKESQNLEMERRTKITIYLIISMGIRQVSGEASEDLETDIFLTISQAFGSSTKNKDKEQATKRAKAGKITRYQDSRDAKGPANRDH